MLSASGIGGGHGRTNISVWTGAELAEVEDQPAAMWGWWLGRSWVAAAGYLQRLELDHPPDGAEESVDLRALPILCPQQEDILWG